MGLHRGRAEHDPAQGHRRAGAARRTPHEVAPRDSIFPRHFIFSLIRNEGHTMELTTHRGRNCPHQLRAIIRAQPKTALPAENSRRYAPKSRGPALPWPGAPAFEYRDPIGAPPRAKAARSRSTEA